MLRIYEKLPYMVKEGGEAVSLDGIKPIKSCGEKIEFFVPESTKNWGNVQIEMEFSALSIKILFQFFSGLSNRFSLRASQKNVAYCYIIHSFF